MSKRANHAGAIDILIVEPAMRPRPAAMESDARYFLDQDNDNHWYVVPLAWKDAWESWKGINSEDERAWTVPEFARAVGGSPTLVTFTDPEIA